jgi:uncharacterized membrane protein YkgB
LQRACRAFDPVNRSEKACGRRGVPPRHAACQKHGIHTENGTLGGRMELLLIVGVVLVILALLGLSGLVAALRGVAWLILVLAIVVIVLSFVF